MEKIIDRFATGKKWRIGENQVDCDRFIKYNIIIYMIYILLINIYNTYIIVFIVKPIFSTDHGKKLLI